MEVAMAIAAWAYAAVGQNLPSCLQSRGNYDMTDLQAKLSSSAKIYYPNTTEFEAASARWSLLGEPTVSVVVVPGTENDVAQTVSTFVFPIGMHSVFRCVIPRLVNWQQPRGQIIRLSIWVWTDSASGPIRQPAGLALLGLHGRSWIPHFAGQNDPGN